MRTLELKNGTSELNKRVALTDLSRGKDLVVTTDAISSLRRIKKEIAVLESKNDETIDYRRLVNVLCFAKKKIFTDFAESDFPFLLDDNNDNYYEDLLTVEQALEILDYNSLRKLRVKIKQIVEVTKTGKVGFISDKDKYFYIEMSNIKNWYVVAKKDFEKLNLPFNYDIRKDVGLEYVIKEDITIYGERSHVFNEIINPSFEE